jgi:hypothetical protein
MNFKPKTVANKSRKAGNLSENSSSSSDSSLSSSSLESSASKRLKRKAKKILNKAKKKKEAKKAKKQQPINFHKIIEEEKLTKRLRIDNYAILLSLLDSGDSEMNTFFREHCLSAFGESQLVS